MLQKLKSFLHRYQLPILAGFFIGTSYIPFPPWASFFCFVPLWVYWWNNQSIKKCFVSGWITQFLLTLIGFNWVAYLTHEFGHLPWAVSIIALLIFAAFANLYVALAGATWAWLTKKLALSRRQSWLLMPLLVFIFEWSIPTIFPWNYGYTWFWAKMPIYQLAEYVGFVGLSALTIFINLGMFAAWQNRKTRKFFVPFSFTILTILLLNGLGYWTASRVPAPDASARVLITQANIGNLEKIYAEKGWGFINHIKDKYVKLSQKALQESKEKVDFVVWPETAYPEKIGQGAKFLTKASAIMQLTHQNKVSAVIGAYSVGPKKGRTANSVFAFNEQGQMYPKNYSKNKLLVFGEYIPFGDVFPKLYDLIPAGKFEAGEGATLLEVGGIKIGPQVCYESLFPSLTGRVADLGSQIIVNVTNDSWYGTWQEPYQHLYMTLARAVEYRRPIVRSTNTGISTVALASGEVLEQSPLHQEWTGLYEVPYRTEPAVTFYQNFPLLIPLLALFTILAITGSALIGNSNKS